MFNYTRCGLTFDIGYDFWATSCEKIIKNGCPSPLDDGRTWALKGDAAVIGFDSVTTTPVRLAATDSQATIHAGTNFPAQGTQDAAVILTARTNPNIDTPFLATDNLGNTIVINPAASPQINSSLDPLFLSVADVDLVGTHGLSNKFFAHLGYAWDLENWTPYIGGGFEVEFGSNGPCNSCTKQCVATCNPCVKCSVTQMGGWIKGGVAF